MESWILWFLLFQSIVQYPQPVGDDWDELTRQRMEAHAKLQEEERMHLEREVEKLALEQEACASGALLWCAWHNWQMWAVAGLVLLLLGLCYVWRKRSLRRRDGREENDGANEGEVRNGHANEEDVGNEEGDAGNEEDEGNDVNGAANNNEDGNAQEADNDGANEEGAVGNGAGNELVDAANNNAIGIEMDEPDPEDSLGRAVMARVQWPARKLHRGCRWVTELMESFAFYFQHVLSDSFYPVLGGAIGVGSAFEGWSPREHHDVVYQVFIPMSAPRGHSFHLELEAAGHRRLRNFRVRVQQECSCPRKQQGENTLCFLHDPEEELRKQDPSLLQTLCTDSYLDVEKTARWFYQLVRAVWPALHLSHNWYLVPLPDKRCCQFKVTNHRTTFRIEILFGVQQGSTDLYVGSQPRQAYTSSTTWPETFAVAEMKFFNYIAGQAPRGSVHLKCLQFFTRLQLGLGFSTYTMKTIVMHLLNMKPVSQWHRRYFVRRLLDISESLRACVDVRRLNHFIVGNRRLPECINLPQEVLEARPCNLFHDLVMNPVAHSQAMDMYVDLHEWLVRIINNEQ